MDDRIVLAEESQPLINLEALLKKAATSVGLRKRCQGVNVIGAVFQNTLEE